MKLKPEKNSGLNGNGTIDLAEVLGRTVSQIDQLSDGWIAQSLEHRTGTTSAVRCTAEVMSSNPRPAFFQALISRLLRFVAHKHRHRLSSFDVTFPWPLPSSET